MRGHWCRRDLRAHSCQHTLRKSHNFWCKSTRVYREVRRRNVNNQIPQSQQHFTLAFSHISYFFAEPFSIIYRHSKLCLPRVKTETYISTKPQPHEDAAVTVPNRQFTFTSSQPAYRHFSPRLSQGSNTACKPPSFLKLETVLAGQNPGSSTVEWPAV